MRRTLGVIVLGSLLLAASPAPAFAHAEVIRSSPRNGSTVARPPQLVTITFGENVSLDAAGTRVTAPDGSVLDAESTISGPVLRVRPLAHVPRGSITVSFHVVSEDGHPVSGAIAFVVTSAGPRGAPQTIATTPSVPGVIDGRRPGLLTVLFRHAVTGGTVQWTSTSQPEPITWRVRPDGRRAVASGVLPRAGTWQMRATLPGRKFTVVIVTGSVTLVP